MPNLALPLSAWLSTSGFILNAKKQSNSSPKPDHKFHPEKAVQKDFFYEETVVHIN